MGNKSHQRMNKNIFSFDVALFMNLFKNGRWAGYGFTVNGLDEPDLGQSGLKK